MFRDEPVPGARDANAGGRGIYVAGDAAAIAACGRGLAQIAYIVYGQNAPGRATKWMNTIVLQLGNGVSTMQIGDVFSCFERYGLMDKYLNYSTTPTYPDAGAPYSQTVNGSIL